MFVVVPNMSNLFLIGLVLSLAISNTTGKKVAEHPSPFGHSVSDYSITRTFQDGNGWIGSLYEGDIMLSRDEAEFYLGRKQADILETDGFVFRHAPENHRRRQLGVDGKVVSGESAAAAAAATSGNNLWTARSSNGKLRVPYEYAVTFSNAQKAVLLAGMRLVESSGVVEFVTRTNDEQDFIQIGGGYLSWSCYSNAIGRVSGRGNNYINIGNRCFFEGVVAHELMHALGFWHEQSRADRDDYISISLENVDINNVHNFNKKETNSLGSPYDFDSVMHYFLNAFSRNDLNTIIPIVPVPFEVVHIGQVSRLSYEDKMQMRYLYQCSFGPRTAAQYQAVPCSADCPCWEDAFAECSFNYECQGDLVCTSDTIAPPTGCNDTPAYYSTEDSSGVMGPFDCDDPALDAGVGGTCQQGQTSDMCRNYCALPCPPTAAEVLEEPSRMCRVGCVNNAQCPDDSAPVCFEGACIDGDPDAPTMNPTSFPTSSPTVSNGRNCPRGDIVFLFGCKG